MCDEIYMAHALRLARGGLFTTAPNPNVGCVIVHNNQIVGEGYHRRPGEAHAEVHALRMAGERARDATAYVTLEPCSHFGLTPPCCNALIEAGIKRVVVAAEDPNPQVAGRGLKRLAEAGIEVNHGLMREESYALNRGFFKRMLTGRPWVQLKLAMSLDGRTAMASGESQWITTTHARQDVQRFRAMSSAILTSSATVLADNPLLTVRWSELNDDVVQQLSPAELRQPVRVVIDSQSRVMPTHRLVSQTGETWLARPQPDEQNWPAGVRQMTVPTANQRIDIHKLLLLLGKEKINSLWVEAGASLAGALLQAELVDELILYIAPKLLGDDARSLCQLPGLARLADGPAFRFTDCRQVGADLRLILTPEAATGTQKLKQSL